ncbi:ABC transporter substrate-binding protein [Virgibacillus doumboii]|uniref:ABC transporter substrate-binding protein n=1 Tax=Virgibacillus doumboii TaxID=2697503 RepID=UPI0019685C64|nr:sugar ABC transporter substrate-binding protein [Virgibacillus doumboii]
MRNKFSFLVVMLLAIIIVIAGCSSSSGNDGDGDSGSDNEGTTLTVATVNNPDMKIMQELTKKHFEKETGIEVEFVVLPETDLRKKVTEDVALGAGAFDIVTISTYDTPIWAENGWIEPISPYLNELTDEEKKAYDLEDIFPSMRSALTYDDSLYALPFYGESTMLYYNKEIFKEVGLEMPKRPTWEEVGQMARTIKEETGNPGIVLRGLPGWGEMMAPLTTVINAFGGRYYDENWNAQLNSEGTVNAVEFYVDLLKDAGQPGATSTGYTEALTIMSTGKAAMWYDATVAAGTLNNPEDSSVVGKIGYAFAPTQVKEQNTGGLYAWSLAIEKASKNKDAAFEFIKWSTSKEYVELVGEEKGWVVAPSGTRISTYENPKYQEAAPFSDMVLESIQSVDYDNPTVDPVPYVGAQYVAIPEFQSLGTEVSQQIAAAIAGDKTVEEAMEEAQKLAEQAAKEGGYK